eukprot:TRINITY_DN1097_c0_g1_i1.p1 TRINITY_DN1097_c0_g1~~TRINITY_DN1097_c0_g1_i1.p1  ORF type:complete len:2193 (+),score=167.35 TRINITY_DN1097_c0_g1_i1:16766-23344(+)
MGGCNSLIKSIIRKECTSGQDSYEADSSVQDSVLFGIDEGSSSSRDLEEIEDQFFVRKSTGQCIIDPSVVIGKAYKQVSAVGSATAVVCVLNARELTCANIGDSGFLLIRFADCNSPFVLLQSEPQQHTFNTPYQLTKLPSSAQIEQNLRRKGSSPEQVARILSQFGKQEFCRDAPETAHLYQTTIQEGDLLIVATDGVLDNLFPEEMLAAIQAAVKGRAHGAVPPQEIASEIATRAYKKSKSLSEKSPFSEALSKTHGLRVLVRFGKCNCGNRVGRRTILQSQQLGFHKWLKGGTSVQNLQFVQKGNQSLQYLNYSHRVLINSLHSYLCPISIASMPIHTSMNNNKYTCNPCLRGSIINELIKNMDLRVYLYCVIHKIFILAIIMREENLLCDVVQAPPPTTKRRRVHPLAGLALVLLALVSVGAFCFYRASLNNSASPAAPPTKGHYLNHYSVDSASVKYEEYQVTCDLVLEPNPDYGNDVVQPTEHNHELKKLRAVMTTESDHRMHVKILDAEKARWEVPLNTEEVSYDDQDFLLGFQKFSIKRSGFNFTQDQFSFTLLDRDSPANTIVTTDGAYFRYMEKYLVAEFVLDSDRIFGLGERLANFSLREGNYTIFSRDQGAVIETRANPGHNLYGSHPFMLYQLRNGQFAAIFFKTSNALQVNLKFTGTTTTVRYSTVGGIMDFYILYKGDAQFILQQYHNLVGKPMLPPLWSLGYHYGRSGVKTLKDLKELVNNFTTKGIPLDAIWIDSEILEDGKNFMMNTKDFSGLKEYVNEVRSKHNIHFVPVLDPGLKADPTYSYYKKMAAEDLLVRNDSGTPFIGRTRVGKVGFPNFWNVKTQEIWQSGVKAFVEATGMEGFWLNLNEFSQLCDGECDGSTTTLLPFVPGDTPLEKNTLPMNATYTIGDKSIDPFLYELNVHSLNAYLMANATAHAFSGNEKRTFLASRSTYPGIQKLMSAHWLGETPSAWTQLSHSIPAVMSFSAFGLPLVGSSICGFNGTADEELCSRWTQLGLLYPLSLNLNSDFHSNSLFDFSEKTKALTVNAIQTKYSLLRYIYTNLFEQSLYGGATVRPLFFEFPNDPLAYRTTDRVFMYGTGLMVTSPLEKDQQTYSVYFPNANWYKFPMGDPVLSYNENRTEGILMQTDVLSEQPNVFVRGGTILPYQDAIGLKVKNVNELNEMPMNLIIALNDKNEASGRMVVDDGISKDTIKSTKYRHYSFTFSHKTLKVMLINGYDYNTPPSDTYQFEHFDSLQIWGASALKNISSACLVSNVMSRRGLKTLYDEKRNVLTVYDISKRKFSLKAIETIAMFADDDYNFCLGGFVASKIKITDQLRRMTALLETALDLSERKYRMDAILMNDYVLNLKISPTNWKAWEVPGIVDPKERNSTKGKMAFAEYLFAISTDPDPFFFAVANPGDPEDTTITTQDMPLVLDEHFIEVSTLVKATEIYGLGERVYPHFALKDGIYTLFTHDAVSPLEDGEVPGKNIYGSHPFYMFKMPDGTFGGVFMLSSNAMDVSIVPFGEALYKVDHISTGGLIDMFIIQRGPPKMILEQYHNIIGKPHVLPFWAFGNHQCRYGYSTQARLREVVEKYAKAKLPLDALWVDIDYMDSHTPFTLDKKRYPSMPGFVNWLHKQNIKIVPIVEAAIPINGTNKAYKTGLELEIFIKRGASSNTLKKYEHIVGVVWPGYSTFVDFVNPKSEEYWISMLEYIGKDLFPFDGIWLDMNEVTNFCDGECDLNGPNRKPWQAVNENFKDLPYIPGHRSLQLKSLPLEAQHYSPSLAEKGNYIEYNLHSMYAHYQMKATNAYFAKHNQRPFIISRSTFAGSGRYGSHWLGDNKSRWEFLSYSIVGIYNFQMFGIPFTGADVCGFAGNTTVELCQRWYQLAAFYPFCRNHNDRNTTDQEPYSTEPLAATARVALQLRYSLIRYMYTLHMTTAMKGGVYFMPLFYEFPYDTETYKETEQTFMVGSALKISPVLNEGATQLTTYFPNSNWYSLENGQKVLEFNPKEKLGKNITLDADLKDNLVNVHVRGGQILPLQNTKQKPVMTTQDLKERETGFIVAPDHMDQAVGTVIFDDESMADVIEKKAYKMLSMNYQKGKMVFDTSAEGLYEMADNDKEEFLGEVKVFNAKAYKNIRYACANLHTGTKVKLDAAYKEDYEVLNLTPVGEISIGEIRSIVWDDEHIKCQLWFLN